MTPGTHLSPAFQFPLREKYFHSWICSSMSFTRLCVFSDRSVHWYGKYIRKSVGVIYDPRKICVFLVMEMCFLTTLQTIYNFKCNVFTKAVNVNFHWMSVWSIICILWYWAHIYSEQQQKQGKLLFFIWETLILLQKELFILLKLHWW